MIFPDLNKLRIYIKPGFTDMRKAINGLSIIVQDQMALDTFGSYIFLFCNKNRKILKALYWDKCGFCLWTKKLEKEKFPWLINDSMKKELTLKELEWLLRGIDFFNEHEKLIFSSVL